MTTINLTAADGHRFSAYLTGPENAAHGVIVVQEVFGVNGHIRSVADRMAEAGYRVVAPALYDRVERNLELGYDAGDLNAGLAIAGKLAWDDTLADLNATVADLDRPCGVMGFCWGGTAAWMAAAKVPVAAAVGYYGSGIPRLNELEPKVPTMLHFGREDQSAPLDQVEAVQAAHPEVTVHLYDAGHGFNCDQRASYDADAAALAWERTVAFFAEHIG
ncbi:MAG: dienelactone hydrolase family protein [Acidimicrobiales bacterium]